MDGSWRKEWPPTLRLQPEAFRVVRPIWIENFSQNRTFPWILSCKRSFSRCESFNLSSVSRRRLSESRRRLSVWRRRFSVSSTSCVRRSLFRLSLSRNPASCSFNFEFSSSVRRHFDSIFETSERIDLKIRLEKWTVQKGEEVNDANRMWTVFCRKVDVLLTRISFLIQNFLLNSKFQFEFFEYLTEVKLTGGIFKRTLMVFYLWGLHLFLWPIWIFHFWQNRVEFWVVQWLWQIGSKVLIFLPIQPGIRRANQIN